MLPRRCEHAVFTQQEDGAINIYDQRSTVAKKYVLRTGMATIWRACDGASDMASIVSQVSRELMLSAASAEKFVSLGLEELARASLIENTYRSPLKGVSRREALYNFGALIAISTLLLAPKSAWAS